MSQNVITTEDVEFRPVLTLVTTEAPYQSRPDKARIAQIDHKTIVIDFQKPAVPKSIRSERSRNRMMSRLYDYGVVALVSSSAFAAVYMLLNLQS